MENGKKTKKQGLYPACKFLATKFPFLLFLLVKSLKTSDIQQAAVLAVDNYQHDYLRPPSCCLNKQIAGQNTQQGFTLVEVLVAVLVLSVGLIGIAGTQLVGLKNNDSSYLRTQASLYAYDIMDRMRANRAAAVAGEYNAGDPRVDPNPPDAIPITDLAVPGAGAPIAQTDRYGWFRRLSDGLPDSPDTQAAIRCDANGVCTVAVQWDDARAECGARDDPNCINDTQIKWVRVAGQL